MFPLWHEGQGMAPPPQSVTIQTLSQFQVAV
jgi:hypothetical protein